MTAPDDSPGHGDPTATPTDGGSPPAGRPEPGSDSAADASESGESTPDGESGAAGRAASEGPGFLRRDRLTVVVATVALLALVLRFVDLGVRVAHWQEARLGWWIDQYARTGVDPGNPALGGSLLRILGRVTAGLLGTADLAIRAPVALAGGLLPMAALGFRRRLDEVEVAALAVLLALAPLLVYYTRFASVDALAAGLAFGTVAAIVALRDRPRGERVILAVLLGVLTLGAAPRAGLGHLVALLLAWGVGLIAIPPAAFAGDRSAAAGAQTAARDRADPPSPIPERLRTVWRTARTVAVPAGAVLLVLLLDPGLPGDVLGSLTSPVGLVGVLLDPVVRLLGHLELVAGAVVATPRTVAGAPDLIGTLVLAAPLVTGLAVVGGLAERWADRPARPLVTVTLAWAALGIPLHLLVAGAGTPWIATHVLVALTVPAAVGAVAAARWTRAGLRSGDPLTGAAGLLTLVLVGGVLVASLVSGVYLAPTDPGSAPVQYGQPSQELRGPLDTLAETAVADGQVDLVLYGSHFVDPARQGLEPRCSRWYNALPLPWYTAASGAEVDCATSETDLRSHLDANPSLVVGREGPLAAIAPGLDNYTATTLQFRAWNANTTVLVRDPAP